MAYRTRNNITFWAHLFWFIAYRTRNITVAASFFRFYECFLFCVFRFFVLEQGILISEGTYFALWLKEEGILLLERACFTLWLKGRGKLHFGAPLFCLMAYTCRTRKLTLGACFFCFIGYRTRNTVEPLDRRTKMQRLGGRLRESDREGEIFKSSRMDWYIYSKTESTQSESPPTAITDSIITI